MTALTESIILASGSAIRGTLLRNAGVPFDTHVVRLDEEAIRDALLQEGATPRDIADHLAELKSMRAAVRHPDALVIGCDQVLAFGRDVLGKPGSLDEARAQLMTLRGREHRLLSAVVVCRNGEPLWRHVGEARLTMRDFSDAWLDGYMARHGDSLMDTVGGYKLEAEGVRLFSRIEGDYFTILGLPLLPLLSWLGLRGTIPS
jgi:septum formation protein